jgi:hypothetical protein
MGARNIGTISSSHHKFVRQSSCQKVELSDAVANISPTNCGTCVRCRPWRLNQMTNIISHFDGRSQLADDRGVKKSNCRELLSECASRQSDRRRLSSQTPAVAVARAGKRHLENTTLAGTDS